MLLAALLAAGCSLLAPIEGVLCDLAPGEHTPAILVWIKAAEIDQLVTLLLGAIPSRVDVVDDDAAAILGAVQPLLIAKSSLEWISDIVELGERTPHESSPLERMTAQAVGKIEEARRMCRPEEGSELSDAFMKAQCAASELLILCCGRALELEELMGRGIPKSLRDRLNAACGCSVDQDKLFWSKLGKAKYHVYTPGKQWGGAKRQKWVQPIESNQSGLDEPASRADITEKHHVDVAIAISLEDLLDRSS